LFYFEDTNIDKFEYLSAQTLKSLYWTDGNVSQLRT